MKNTDQHDPFAIPCDYVSPVAAVCGRMSCVFFGLMLLVMGGTPIYISPVWPGWLSATALVWGSLLLIAAFVLRPHQVAKLGLIFWLF